MTERHGPLAAVRHAEAVADTRGRPAVPALDRRAVVAPLVPTLPDETPGDTAKEALVVESARRPAAVQPGLFTPRRPGAGGCREVTRSPAGVPPAPLPAGVPVAAVPAPRPGVAA